MHYSLPRDGRSGDLPKVLHDWICANCGVQNFRRRENCFKCNGPKTENESEGADEVSSQPTNTVLLRNLDVLSTEDSVLNYLKTFSELPIKSIKIGRDSLTNTSRGICYVEMNTVMDAMFLHNHLLGTPPVIDEKLVSVSYYRSPQFTGQNQSYAVANAALAAAQWSHQGSRLPKDTQLSSQNLKMSDNQAPKSAEEIEKLAEYSASLYAKTPEEKQSYLEYYRNYYKNGTGTAESAPNALPGNENLSSSKSNSNPHAGINPSSVNLGTVSVEGVSYNKYPEPNVSTYVYEESSGYYYDATTGLYYDSNSQYYYNSSTNQYLYWSGDHQTYLPAPESAEEKTKDDVKEDKAKSAKKIAKDMEKWAKSQNQKKESLKSSVSKESGAEQPGKKIQMNHGNSGSEDIAFSIMQKKPLIATSASASNNSTGLAGLANYGSDSEDDGTTSSGAPNVSELTDWKNLACLLCKRQFPSREKLEKHNQISELHKSNLSTWYKTQQKGKNQGSSFQYRDRAKERRQKYGVEDEGPRPNKLKEKYLRAMEEVETSSLSTAKQEKNIDSSNIGNKMLQKMGWKEGLGLGKSNQGRTSIIEADRRASLAGLGSGGASIKAGPNDSYRDAVKKTLFQRFQDFD